MRKIINYFYNKYCRQDIDSAYISAIQRDFSKELNEKDERVIKQESQSFVDSEAFEYIFNQKLKAWVEVLLCKGQTNEMRDFAVSAINIIVDLEDSIKIWGLKDDQEVQFDKHSIL